MFRKKNISLLKNSKNVPIKVISTMFFPLSLFFRFIMYHKILLDTGKIGKCKLQKNLQNYCENQIFLEEF